MCGQGTRLKQQLIGIYTLFCEKRSDKPSGEVGYQADFVL